MGELISIIIPVYNVEQYLERCMNTVLHQTYENLEIILVDDGSTDRSGEMCDRYAEQDERVQVIHKENGGASAARNVGLQNVHGVYVCFVDSDDWIETDMLSYMMELMQEDSDVDMIIGDAYNQFDKCGKIEIWNHHRCLEHFFRTRGEKDTHNVWGRLYKVEMLKDFCFLEGRMNEDVIATYELANRCQKAIYTTKHMYNYLKNEGGVTNSPITEKKMDLLYVWDLVYKKVKEENVEFLYPCEMNMLRARFTLLSQMRINGFDKKDVVLQKKQKELKKQVRRGYWKLMKWKMPISRKILLHVVIF